MRHHIVLLAGLALQVTLPAQESTYAALVVRTSSAELAMDMMAAFNSEASTLELVDGSHIVLTLDDGGMINARVTQGEAPYLALDARPAQLMEIFADRVSGFEQMAQMMGGMAGMQAGLDAADISQVLDEIFSFPDQVDAFYFTLQKDPSTDGNIDATLQMNPKSGSWFGSLVSNLQVHPKGLLSILDPQAMITFESNIDISKLGEALRPFIAFSTKMTAKPGEDSAKATQLMDNNFKAIDGTFSMNLSPGQGGMVGLSGLRDVELYKKILHGGDMTEFYAIQQRKNRMVEYEIEESAFVHRDIKVVKVTQYMEGMGSMGGNPFADSDGSMTSLLAVAGECALVASAGAEIGEMKHLIDSVADQSINRKTLGTNTLAKSTVRLAELAEFFGQISRQGFGDAPDLPEDLMLLLKQVDGNLLIEVTSK